MATDMGTLQKRKKLLAHNLKQRCIKKNFKGIHNRFLRDPDFHKAMHEHDRDEKVCFEWDDLADKDFTRCVTESKYFRYKKNSVTRCVRSLGKTTDERLSRICFIVRYFVAIGSFTADGGLLQPTGGEKTTPPKTRFRSVRIYKICKDFSHK